MRVVLVSAVAFLAAWMTFLKPTTEDVEPATTTATPAVTAPRSTAKPVAAATPAAPARDLEGVPAPVARAIERHEVVVLGFFNGRAPEDRAVRAALRNADRWDGRVHVAVAPVDAVSRYGRIARGVDVEQSPTVIVVDRDLNATTLVGYVDTRSIDQAVVDALRASGGLFTDAYLRELNHACTVTASARREAAGWRRLAARLRAIPAPAKWRAFKRAAVADARAAAGAPRARKRLLRRMDARHVLSCGADG
jgi:hypothetical protein